MSRWIEIDIASIREILEEDPWAIFDQQTLENYDLEYVTEVRDIPETYHQRAMVVIRGIGEDNLYGFYMWHGMGKHSEEIWPGEYDAPEEIFLLEEKTKTTKYYEKI